jgi:hypothetical protein
MLTSATRSIPALVEARFDPYETLVATLNGLLESGLALTNKRLFGWRANGVSAPLPLLAIDRILLDTSPESGHVELLVLPRQAVHVALVLTMRLADHEQATLFVELLLEATGRNPVWEHLGPVTRLSFAAPTGPTNVPA